MTVKALILDFGGVVSRTMFETHGLTEAALGLPAGTLTWRGPFDPVTDPLWCMMQSGEISEREYWHRRACETGRLIGRNWTEMSEFVIAARGADPGAIIRAEAIEAMEAAKAADCALAILSNELDLFYGSSFRKKLPFLSQVDAIVDATHTGILKPDRRAYQACVDELGVKPGDCVFVDDQAKNVKGARDAGMQSVHFNVQTPHKSYRQALSLLGVT